MYKIFGKRKVDFTDNSGRRVLGTTIWYGIEDESVEGYQVERGFVTPDVMAYKDIPVDTADVIFNHKGKIVGIDAVID